MKRPRGQAVEGKVVKPVMIRYSLDRHQGWRVWLRRLYWKVERFFDNSEIMVPVMIQIVIGVHEDSCEFSNAEPGPDTLPRIAHRIPVELGPHQMLWSEVAAAAKACGELQTTSVHLYSARSSSEVLRSANTYGEDKRSICQTKVYDMIRRPQPERCEEFFRRQGKVHCVTSPLADRGALAPRSVRGHASDLHPAPVYCEA